MVGNHQTSIYKWLALGFQVALDVSSLKIPEDSRIEPEILIPGRGKSSEPNHHFQLRFVHLPGWWKSHGVGGENLKMEKTASLHQSFHQGTATQTSAKKFDLHKGIYWMICYLAMCCTKKNGCHNMSPRGNELRVLIVVLRNKTIACLITFVQFRLNWQRASQSNNF